MEEISPNNILKVKYISASYQEGKQRKRCFMISLSSFMKMKFSVSSERADAEKIDTLQSDLRIYLQMKAK